MCRLEHSSYLGIATYSVSYSHVKLRGVLERGKHFPTTFHMFSMANEEESCVANYQSFRNCKVRHQVTQSCNLLAGLVAIDYTDGLSESTMI